MGHNTVLDELPGHERREYAHDGLGHGTPIEVAERERRRPAEVAEVIGLAKSLAEDVIGFFDGEYPGIERTAKRLLKKIKKAQS